MKQILFVLTALLFFSSFSNTKEEYSSKIKIHNHTDQYDKGREK